MPPTPQKQSTPTVLGKRTRNGQSIPISPQLAQRARTLRSASKNLPAKKITYGGMDAKVTATATLQTPPATPSKRKARSESGCTPNSTRKLCDITNEILNTPSTSSSTATTCTPLTPSTPSVYTGAKGLFQRGSGSPGKLLCRDVERDILKSFFESHVSNRTAGSLYISGPPGTGKSALMAEVLDDLKDKFGPAVKVANINCMTVCKPALVFCNIFQELIGELLSESSVGEQSVTEKLEQLLTQSSTKQSCIVILDEMDYLMTKDQEILYQAFEWTRLRNSNLVLVGIANALNLTSRFLPKLRARNFVPEILRFTPYTAEQIAKVISARLEAYSRAVTSIDSKGDTGSLIHPAAIQLCARKTAANTGDLRKAFDICKRGLDLAEEDARRKFAAQSDIACQKNRSSMPTPCTTPNRQFTAFTIPPDGVPPKVTIAHIAKICSSAFGGSTVQRVHGLNLQQKAVLCALVVGEKRKASSLTIRELYEHYGALCAKDKLLDRLKISEFREVVSALEVCGVINLSAVGRSGSSTGKSSNSDDRRIAAAVQAIDLLRAVEDVGMLKRFFSGS
ncbi:P-loop containing nucleoside triphosphate hydrolase protein [Lipomyces tetrasporus]|uniref:Cell division control protein n=1 Tax=Lipomyces tetrasporus TaxID=54092 RepID=A0AAD7VPJ3_9ASCO|nr:P-loop containing nucleoside triphosphate hydrolase protein [Lipomyces tetrasporus]KAJ8096836.1 P-loop containing nucleoside triphosphate hydrolase protein [Lipomyces tetrasporus]